MIRSTIRRIMRRLIPEQSREEAERDRERAALMLLWLGCYTLDPRGFSEYMRHAREREEALS